MQTYDPIGMMLYAIHNDDMGATLAFAKQALEECRHGQCTDHYWSTQSLEAVFRLAYKCEVASRQPDPIADATM